MKGLSLDALCTPRELPNGLAGKVNMLAPLKIIITFPISFIYFPIHPSSHLLLLLFLFLFNSSGAEIGVDKMWSTLTWNNWQKVWKQEQKSIKDQQEK